MNADPLSSTLSSPCVDENQSGTMLEPNTTATAGGSGMPLDQDDERINLLWNLLFPQTKTEHLPDEQPQSHCHYPSLQTPAIQNGTKRASSSATTALFETIDPAHEKVAGNNLPHISPLPPMKTSKTSSACAHFTAMPSQPSHNPNHDGDINMPRANEAEGNNNNLLDKVFRLFTHSMRKKFPIKLYIMLESVQDDNNINANANASIAWLPDGCGFCILDKDAFMEVVMPVFFKKCTKVKLFYQQLQSWGFKSVLKGKDAGNWYHQFFLRHAPEEMTKMERNKKKGGKKAIITIKYQMTIPRCASVAKNQEECIPRVNKSDMTVMEHERMSLEDATVAVEGSSFSVNDHSCNNNNNNRIRNNDIIEEPTITTLPRRCDPLSASCPSNPPETCNNGHHHNHRHNNNDVDNAPVLQDNTDYNGHEEDWLVMSAP